MKNITFTDSKKRIWNYEIPFSITCTVSGVVKKYTSEEYINKKIERFDGLDNLRKVYVSRDAKKAAKKAAAPATEVKPVVTTTEPVVVVEAPAEVKPVVDTATINLFADIMMKKPEMLALPEPLPIAKKDKNGKYRNAKGHLISEFNLKNFRLEEQISAVA